MITMCLYDDNKHREENAHTIVANVQDQNIIVKQAYKCGRSV